MTPVHVDLALERQEIQMSLGFHSLPGFLECVKRVEPSKLAQPGLKQHQPNDQMWDDLKQL